ncbi:MAG: glycosyltransferase [Thermoleophilaceae bacterium]|nr:glycosyltransferase [Thermoleophilaceae bacterium]
MIEPRSPAGRARPGPVLFVSYSGLWGGAERLLVDIAGGLSEPAVLVCPDGELASRARDAVVAVLTRPARPRELRGGARTRARAGFHLAAHGREVRMAVASLRPRAVVAFGMRSAIASAAALRTVRDRPPLIFEHVDFLPSPGVARLVRLAAGRAERVVVLSAATASDLDPRRRLASRVRVAMPGVDVQSFTASPARADPPVALLLGAIVDWKRPDLALEAVAMAARELPALRLVVAGHTVGEESERLLERLRRRAAEPDLAGRVEFPGALTDPRPALADASCLLHCADREPFGLVLLEAMACGRPVIAPAAGGPLEIVADGGGRLFEPGDACAAAGALVEMLGDGERLRRAGERARAHAAKNFALADARRRWVEAAALAPAGATDAEAGGGLTLVTVTHNSEHDLGRLLASVARHLPAARVVVVDSGSEDESAALARRFRREILVIERENVGYGRAANAGVALVETPACVVLNPDVELLDDSLAALAAEATRPGTPERLLAPLVLRPDGTRQDSVHLQPVSPAAVITALVPPAALPPLVRRRVQPWRGDRPRAVAWAVACCIGGRTATLRRLGPFDERIFLYGEDLDLGLRARDAGIETWWWPDARVIHHQAHAVGPAFGGEPVELLARQRHAVVAERRGRRIARWDDRLQAVTLADRIVLKALLRRPNARERRQLAALRLAMDARLGER